MKKFLTILTITIGVLLFAGCATVEQQIPDQPISDEQVEDQGEIKQLNYFFGKDNHHAYYLMDQYGGGEMWYELADSDPDSFEIIETPTGGIERSNYAKDKNYVFKDEKRLEGVSSEKFEFIYNSKNRAMYAKDKNNVYIIYGDGIKTYKPFSILKGADPESFIFLDHDSGGSHYAKYSKDNKNAYWGYVQVENADGASFEHVYRDMAKDKNNVYYRGIMVPGVDPATIEHARKDYYKDANFVYECFNKCEVIENPESTLETGGIIKSIDEWKINPAIETIKKYYDYITNGNLYDAYDMKSDPTMSLETFKGWYENTVSASAHFFRETSDKNKFIFNVDVKEEPGGLEIYEVTTKVENNKLQTLSSNLLTIDDFDDWKEYKNEPLGFQMMVPKTFIINKEEYKITLEETDPNLTCPEIAVERPPECITHWSQLRVVANLENLNELEYVVKNYRTDLKNPSCIHTTNKKEFNDIVALEFIDRCAMWPQNEIIFNHWGKHYIFSFGRGSYATLEQMLSTFEFID